MILILDIFWFFIDIVLYGILNGLLLWSQSLSLIGNLVIHLLHLLAHKIEIPLVDLNVVS